MSEMRALDSRNSLTIPKRMREVLGIKEGSALSVELVQEPGKPPQIVVMTYYNYLNIRRVDK
jgi:AbrB family looped-hinge helix DNA binding protein